MLQFFFIFTPPPPQQKNFIQFHNSLGLSFPEFKRPVPSMISFINFFSTFSYLFLNYFSAIFSINILPIFSNSVTYSGKLKPYEKRNFSFETVRLIHHRKKRQLHIHFYFILFKKRSVTVKKKKGGSLQINVYKKKKFSLIRINLSSNHYPDIWKPEVNTETSARYGGSL